MKVGNYGGGGAVQKLHPRKAPTLAIIKVVIIIIIIIYIIINNIIIIIIIIIINNITITYIIIIIIIIIIVIIKELREGLWIDRATRLIIIDFTLYNANINMFCIAKVRDDPFQPLKKIICFGSSRLPQ